MKNLDNILERNQNLTEEEFIEFFDYVLTDYFHRGNYEEARSLVNRISEDDKEKFYKKFVASHSEEHLKKHFTDFENINQKEFNKSIKNVVSGDIENIRVPMVVIDNNTYQFTNKAFYNGDNGNELFLMKDIKGDFRFIEHVYVPDPDGASERAWVIAPEAFNEVEFAKTNKIRTIYDITDVKDVMGAICDMDYDNSKLKEQMSKKTSEEKQSAGKTTLEIVLQSHLSDAILELQNNNPDLVESRLEFCRQLIDKYGDLEIGIKDVDLNNLWTKVWNAKQENEAVVEIDNRKENVVSESVSRDQSMGRTDESSPDIFELPNVIIGHIIKQQQNQGNIADVSVFENNFFARKDEGGFNWDNTSEGLQWHIDVLCDKKFDLFFDKYGKEELLQNIEAFLMQYEPTGELKQYPKEVIEKMLEFQNLEGNSMDVSVFENNVFADKNQGGFTHTENSVIVENLGFWRDVIVDQDFDLFFTWFPKKYDNEHLNNNDLQR